MDVVSQNAQKNMWRLESVRWDKRIQFRVRLFSEVWLAGVWDLWTQAKNLGVIWSFGALVAGGWYLWRQAKCGSQVVWNYGRRKKIVG